MRWVSTVVGRVGIVAGCGAACGGSGGAIWHKREVFFWCIGTAELTQIGHIHGEGNLFVLRNHSECIVKQYSSFLLVCPEPLEGDSF